MEKVKNQIREDRSISSKRIGNHLYLPVLWWYAGTWYKLLGNRCRRQEELVPLCPWVEKRREEVGGVSSKEKDLSNWNMSIRDKKKTLENIKICCTYCGMIRRYTRPNKTARIRERTTALVKYSSGTWWYYVVPERVSNIIFWHSFWGWSPFMNIMYQQFLKFLTLCSRSEHLYMSVRKLRSAVSDSVWRASISRPM